MKRRALEKVFQAEFRSLIAHDGWKFDDDFSGQLHVSCSKALGQDALCGLNIWETGALKKSNSEHGTLQVSGWCRINSLERRVLELFGDKFENPYKATCDGYLRMIAPNMANEYGLYGLCFNDRLGSEIKSFWGSLISQADIFFNGLVSGRVFDETSTVSYFGDPIRWEVRRVVWSVEFNASSK
jgi:hypothetical protein